LLVAALGTLSQQKTLNKMLALRAVECLDLQTKTTKWLWHISLGLQRFPQTLIVQETLFGVHTQVSYIYIGEWVAIEFNHVLMILSNHWGKTLG
jgi:hypothetical protein